MLLGKEHACTCGKKPKSKLLQDTQVLYRENNNFLKQN